MQPERPLHIVHITQHLEIGGLESFIMTCCRSHQNSSIRSSVLCLNGYDERYYRELASIGTRVALISKQHRLDLPFLFRAAAFLRQIRADVVHSHGGCFLYAMLIGKLAGISRLIHTVHGMPVEHGFKARSEERVAASLARHVVAVSEQIADDLRKRLPGINSKLTLIINGIDTERFRPVRDQELLHTTRQRFGIPPAGLLIGSVGRLEPVKNYPLLIRAFSTLVKQGSDAYLLLVGSGSEQAMLQQLAEGPGLAGRVVFTGMQYHLEELYPALDLFVLPSFSEGTSISLLEAQSCGIPAVATAVGGTPQIIRHGENGLLCPSDDGESLAQHLARLLQNSQERQAMGAQGRTRMLHEFSIERMTAHYRRLYSQEPAHNQSATVATGEVHYGR